MKQLKYLILLQGLLIIYTLSSAAGKFAANEPMFSPKFILYYGVMIALLGVYAIGWQQVIKHMDLTAAYASKAATVIYGCLFGVLLFHEQITVGKICGIVLIMAGIILFAVEDGKEHS